MKCRRRKFIMFRWIRGISCTNNSVFMRILSRCYFNLHTEYRPGNVLQLNSYTLARRIYFTHQLCPLIVLSWTSSRMNNNNVESSPPFIERFVNFRLSSVSFSLSGRHDLSKKGETHGAKKKWRTFKYDQLWNARKSFFCLYKTCASYILRSLFLRFKAACIIQRCS